MMAALVGAKEETIRSFDRSEVVVSVKNVSKKFCKTLKRSMAYGIADLSKNLIGIRPNSKGLRKDEFWAVKDVSFELKRGEVLGLIGVNGSGKTTLLRLLSGIFPPDKGEISIKGRVGALIAVGAGFHPYMTGRENIYLNGTILGMSHKEIHSKFEAIVDFAEIGDFLDAPVSTYSSGMRVRLGFSIATAIKPDILLIDEVLAVGDITFRNKCLRKISEIKEKAKAVIFISHDMDQIKAICDRVILLHYGEIIHIGEKDNVLNKYFNLSNDITYKEKKKEYQKDIEKKGIQEKPMTEEITFLDAGILDKNGNLTEKIYYGEDFTIFYELLVNEDIKRPFIGIIIRNSRGFDVFVDNSYYNNNIKLPPFKVGKKYKILITFKKPNILGGAYQLHLSFKNQDSLEVYHRVKNINFQILNKNLCHPSAVIQVESELKCEVMN